MDNVILAQYMILVQEQHDIDHQLVLSVLRQRRRARRRRCWVRPWLGEVRRELFGHYSRLVPELRLEDHASFHNFFRLPPQMFDELLSRLRPHITKQDTRWRKAIDPGTKLAVTLRHLASGDLYASMKFDFRLPDNTISVIVKEVCQAIVDVFKDEVIKCPTTPEEWIEVAQGFERRWNVPHACGALDGKHVAIRKPPDSGSLYHNYKGFFSIVLMALVDADYKFLWIDVGGDGYMSDAMIYNNSELRECLSNGSIGFPPPEPLPHDDQDMPYFLLGDDAFALRTYMMKPFAARNLTKEQRIYNYRISRGRRVVENAFGILSQRWQVLLGTMQQQPQTARLIVEACVCLHNLMRMNYPTLNIAALDHEDANHDIIPGSWRSDAGMLDVERCGGTNKDTVAAKKQREYLKLYFNSFAGSVPWQDRMI